MYFKTTLQYPTTIHQRQNKIFNNETMEASQEVAFRAFYNAQKNANGLMVAQVSLVVHSAENKFKPHDDDGPVTLNQ